MDKFDSQAEPVFPAGGARMALIAVQDEAFSGELEELLISKGYLVVKALGNEAASILSVSQCRIVLIEDVEENDSLFSFLGSLPGNRRRYLVVVLLTSHGLSMDPRLAFSRSVDACLHPVDGPRLPELLEKALLQHQDMYALWRELEDAGVRS